MLNKNAIVPLYAQVKEEIKKTILDNGYGNEGRLPTQGELAEIYGVSLITIKKAIQTLEKEGLIVVKQGKGTFIKKAIFVDNMHSLKNMGSFLEEIQVPYEIEIQKFEIIDTPQSFDEDIQTAYGPRCTFVRRVTKYKGTGVSCADMYLPEHVGRLLTRQDAQHDTIYHLYQKKLGIELGMGRQRIRAKGAGREMAQALDLAYNTPVLELTRRAYDTSHNLIEYMILTYESNSYCFEVELELNKEQDGLVLGLY
ncbi:MAG: GntR family transcriptional regulator [Firmicutes bacterium]|nr:GntR family transcriptional regulator [Bacillota bacterium]